MAAVTAYRRVVAPEPETGKEIWAYEIKRGDERLLIQEWKQETRNLQTRPVFSFHTDAMITLQRS